MRLGRERSIGFQPAWPKGSGMRKKKRRSEGRYAEKPKNSEQELPGQTSLPFEQKKKVICHLPGAPADPVCQEKARQNRGPDCYANGWTCCSLLES